MDGLFLLAAALVCVLGAWALGQVDGADDHVQNGRCRGSDDEF